MMTKTVNKGTRVRYSFFVPKSPPASLSGMQLKFAADLFEGTGTVTHVWVDHPTNPTKYTFVVKPDEGGAELEVPQGGIKEVLEVSSHD